jgi:hypothetical protein
MIQELTRIPAKFATIIGMMISHVSAHILAEQPALRARRFGPARR